MDGQQRVEVDIAALCTSLLSELQECNKPLGYISPGSGMHHVGHKEEPQAPL